ncbi:MAG: hypothetical protein R3B13_37400 [Polyangiaceae bacterium]
MSSRAFVLCLCAAIEACGSRSALVDVGPTEVDSGSGGLGGGSGTTAVGGSGGAAGAAGAGPECKDLVALAPPALLNGQNALFDAPPVLAVAPGVSDEVVLATRAMSSGPSNGIRHTSFRPWGTWPPPDLGASLQMTLAGTEISDDYFVAPSTPGRFALLASPSTGPVLLTAVAPAQDYAGPQLPVLGASPSFLAEGIEGVQLLGMSSTKNELYAQLGRSESDPKATTISTIGCADSQIFGAATPLGSNWLIAYSNGEHAPVAVCGNPTGAGDPKRIDIVSITTGHEVASLATLPVAAPVTELAAAAHQNGMYLVWREAGVANPPARWARFDAVQLSFVAKGELGGLDDHPVGLSAAPFGEGLAVAYVTAKAGMQPQLVVQLQDPFGKVVARASRPSFHPARVALVPSYEHRRLLVGQHDGNSAIALLRFDCVP